MKSASVLWLISSMDEKSRGVLNPECILYMKSCPCSTDCYGFSLFETKTKEADTQVEKRMRERMEDIHTHRHTP
jgi:hypothetical protein